MAHKHLPTSWSDHYHGQQDTSSSSSSLLFIAPVVVSEISVIFKWIIIISLSLFWRIEYRSANTQRELPRIITPHHTHVIVWRFLTGPLSYWFAPALRLLWLISPIITQPNPNRYNEKSPCYSLTWNGTHTYQPSGYRSLLDGDSLFCTLNFHPNSRNRMRIVSTDT